MDYDYTPLYYSDFTKVKFLLPNGQMKKGIAYHEYIWDGERSFFIPMVIEMGKNLGYHFDDVIIEIR